jgi:hypothetical protein
LLKEIIFEKTFVFEDNNIWNVYFCENFVKHSWNKACYYFQK